MRQKACLASSLILSESRTCFEWQWVLRDTDHSCRDAITMGTDGMRYSLPSRDLIADSIESVCAIQPMLLALLITLDR